MRQITLSPFHYRPPAPLSPSLRSRRRRFARLTMKVRARARSRYSSLLCVSGGNSASNVAMATATFPPRGHGNGRRKRPPISRATHGRIANSARRRRWLCVWNKEKWWGDQREERCYRWGKINGRKLKSYFFKYIWLLLVNNVIDKSELISRSQVHNCR